MMSPLITDISSQYWLIDASCQVQTNPIKPQLPIVLYTPSKYYAQSSHPQFPKVPPDLGSSIFLTPLGSIRLDFSPCLVQAPWFTGNGCQFSSVTQSCLTLCDPMNHSTPGLPVRHWLLEFTQTHVHWVGDAIQPSHLLSYPSPHAFNLSLHQGLFKWVSSSHEVAKVLEFQFQHQSFQWTPRTDLP